MPRGRAESARSYEHGVGRSVRILLFFFFFKQKPAYEIGPRDWSSDVCSSDLSPWSPIIRAAPSTTGRPSRTALAPSTRSEERRVGKEGRSRGSPYHYKKHTKRPRRERRSGRRLAPPLSPASPPDAT